MSKLNAVIEKALQDFVKNRVELGYQYHAQWLNDPSIENGREALLKAMDCFEEANIAEAHCRSNAGLGPCYPSSGHPDHYIAFVRETFG